MRDGWAAGVGRPGSQLRRLLARVLPVAAVVIALVIGAWVLWPRTESVESQAQPLPGTEAVTTPPPAETTAAPSVSTDAPATTATSTTAAPATPETTAPRVDEPEAVLAYGRRAGIALVQPVAIPTGWSSDGAEVVAAAVTPEQCEQAGLYWLDPNDPDFGFMDTYQFPISCAQAQPDDAQPFVAGLNQGWVVEDSRAGWHIELVVGTTVLQVWSDLGPEPLRRILSDLVSYDPVQGPPATLALS